MIENISSYALTIVGTVITANIVLSCLLYLLFRKGERRIEKLTRETFGLYRKIEGLTADERQRFKIRFSELRDSLARELPTTVAARAGELIFEAESEVLRRLAELEPGLKEDAEAQQKMHDLIQKMEKLEITLLSATSEAVRSVLDGQRDALTDDFHSSKRQVA